MKMMTKSALLLAAALIATPVAKASAETIPGWYAGLGAGLDFQTETNNHTPGSTSFKFNKPSYDVLGNGGYAWDSGLRLEGEAFRSTAVVKHVDGALNNTDVFANALYDFNIGSMFTPYVGAGAGVAFVDADNMGVGAAHVKGGDTKAAYQGIAGVATQIDRNWAVTADYRYISSFDPKISTTVGGKDKLNDTSHNIIIGVRYNFDVPAPVAPKMTEAPAVQPRMAAKPMVAPVPQTFQVFFDFNKADLTPEAKRIIASAAQEYKQGGFVRIVVTGHTDTVGSDKYNKSLSDHRAAAVKTEFAKLGVSAGVVVTQGVGKNGLLVPTNDGVREAQNRRAEIVLGKN